MKNKEITFEFENLFKNIATYKCSELDITIEIRKWDYRDCLERKMNIGALSGLGGCDYGTEIQIGKLNKDNKWIEDYKYTDKGFSGNCIKELAKFLNESIKYLLYYTQV